eukprot:TRINITY_DN5201_c0_g1_i1.p1 TRINITY_DN5201_c0_g1~~TRINITY_DN5201_c0_g1_i1.p1  ORF type:complete len:377 (+),score=101.42 TRINITY_DN5201_c0_g1_i1:65-1195(+)
MCSDMNPSGAATEYVFKMLLLGASGVGKTHLAMRFVKGGVLSHTEPTIGVDFASRVVQAQDGALVRLQLWDTAGAKRYRHHDLGTVYRHGVCAALVYDVTERASFEALEELADELNCTSGVDASRMVLVVVGNKRDLAPRAVPAEEGQAYAETRGWLYAETSAAKNENVDELFENTADAVLARLVTGADSSDEEGGAAPLCESFAAAAVLKEVDGGASPAAVRKVTQRRQHRDPNAGGGFGSTYGSTDIHDTDVSDARKGATATDTADASPELERRAPQRREDPPAAAAAPTPSPTVAYGSAAARSTDLSPTPARRDEADPPAPPPELSAAPMPRPPPPESTAAETVTYAASPEPFPGREEQKRDKAESCKCCVLQ